jgi:hypothetical protein
MAMSESYLCQQKRERTTTSLKKKKDEADKKRQIGITAEDN